MNIQNILEFAYSVVFTLSYFIVEVLFYTNMLKRNKDLDKYLYAYTFLYLVIGYYVSRISHPLLNLLFSTSTSLFLALVFFKRSVKKKIFVSVFYLFFCIFTEIVSEIILEMVMGNKYSWNSLDLSFKYIVNSIEFVVCFFFVQIMIRMKKNKEIRSANPLLYAFTFLMPAVTLLIFITSMQLELLYLMENRYRIFMFVLSNILLFANLANFLAFDYIFDISEKNLIYRSMSIKNELDKKYYDKIISDYENRRKFYHDINNCLSAIARLMKNKDTKEIESIISEIGIKVKDFNKVLFCKNNTLNAVLTDKIGKCTDLKIDNFNIDVAYTVDFKGISDLDIIIIVGNLLDNAIEASENIENPEIDFVAYNFNNSVIIDVKNRYNGINKVGDRFVSTKSDSIHHGIGLNNVINTVKKYDGNIQIKTDQNIFHVSIIMDF